jgi:hypothetical protein
MNDSPPPVFILFVVFVFIAAFIIGGIFSGIQWQKEAIKTGVAEWVADANGDAKFQFKTK